MRIGTQVHTLLEAFINHQTLLESPKDKYNSRQFADALFDALNPLVLNWNAVEPHLVNETYKIHGTADAIVTMKEGLTVLDWKTSASKSITHPIQLAIYALCWNDDPKRSRVDRGVIARVDKKSNKLSVHLDIWPDNNPDLKKRHPPLSHFFPIVKALRTIWQYSNDK